MLRIRATREAVGSCPYLPDRVWITNVFGVDHLPEALYEQLLSYGWRRSGHSFYQNQCENCGACVPIRIPVAAFKPSKKQRRIIRKNRDLIVSVHPRRFREEVYRLFSRYETRRHAPNKPTGRESFRRFLCDSAVGGHEMHYRLPDGTLVGVGWVDEMPLSISTVYFAFDPAHADRSLGVFSILYEIEYARAGNKRYHHLGFYVAGTQKMAYKSSFFPHEQLITPNTWQRFNSREELADRDPSATRAGMTDSESNGWFQLNIATGTQRNV